MKVTPIPDEHLVYMRIHKTNIDFKAVSTFLVIRPVAFDAKGEGGLSVDWSAHSTPQETLERAKIPLSNGVVSMPVLGIRSEPFTLKVLHSPIDSNYSHSEIYGIPPRKPSDFGVRVKLMDLVKWEIECAEDL